MGGTMRLGAWTCILQPDSLAAKAYTYDLSFRPEHGVRSGEICSSDGWKGTALAVPQVTNNDAGFSPGGSTGQSIRDGHGSQVLEISERHRRRYEFYPLTPFIRWR